LLQDDLKQIGINIVPTKIDNIDKLYEITEANLDGNCIAQNATGGGPFPIGQEFYTSDYISPDDWTQNNALSYGSANDCMAATTIPRWTPRPRCCDPDEPNTAKPSTPNDAHDVHNRRRVAGRADAIPSRYTHLQGSSPTRWARRSRSSSRRTRRSREEDEPEPPVVTRSPECRARNQLFWWNHLRSPRPVAGRPRDPVLREFAKERIFDSAAVMTNGQRAANRQPTGDARGSESRRRSVPALLRRGSGTGRAARSALVYG